MFNYDKTIKRLNKFNELSNKKQGKVLESILCSSEFREWFYNIGDNAKDQPMTKPMITRIIETLSSPKVIRRVIKFINNKSFEDFDRTSCSLGYLIVEQAMSASNAVNKEITDGYKSGELQPKEAKAYKHKSEKYSENISGLMDALKAKAKPEIKEISKKSNLPKEFVLSTYFMFPGKKYIPRYKVGIYMNQLLQEIYKWVGKNGIDDVSMIRWESYFEHYFGSDLTASVALSVLLEGVTRINAYRDLEYFEDVRRVWDSLTNFALSDLNNAPENVRKQMIELYIKRIDRLFRNGNGPRMRVNMLKVPDNFTNLVNTLEQYTNRIARIVNPNWKISNNDRHATEGDDCVQMNRSENKDSLYRKDDTDDSDGQAFNFVNEDDEDDDE